MNLKDSSKIVTLLSAAYPSMRGQDENSVKAQAALWLAMFPKDDYDTVKAAVLDYIATDEKGFPPKIGQIKAKLPQEKPLRDHGWMKAYIDKQYEERCSKYGGAEGYAKHLQAVLGGRR